eukprot:SM000002S05539  [mRNA]  locus=s2:650963:655649:- [translate_table: standard]
MATEQGPQEDAGGRRRLAVGKMLAADIARLRLKAGTPRAPGITPHDLLRLSKLLDCSVGYEQKPHNLDALRELLMWLWQLADNPAFRPALMALMLSVKSVCRLGWFKQQKVVELMKPLQSLWGHFVPTQARQSSTDDLQRVLAPSGGAALLQLEGVIDHVKRLSSRYFPTLRLRSVLMAMKAEQGYQVLTADFGILIKLHRDYNVHLLSSQYPDISTSASLATPLQVSFLLNGVEVPGRTLVKMEKGLQMPTLVNDGVRVGPNLLQVIGEFTAPYIVVVALMKSIKLDASKILLEPHVTPTIEQSRSLAPGDVTTAGLARSDSDELEIILGPTKLSLLCPISHKRMVRPVKGVACRHVQSFDLSSFLEINTSLPAWRCPCCNSHTSFVDLRLDAVTAEILENTRNMLDTAEALVLEDGSWRLIKEVKDLQMRRKRQRFASESASEDDKEPRSLPVGQLGQASAAAATTI